MKRGKGNRIQFDHWEDSKGNRVDPGEYKQHEGKEVREKAGVKRLKPRYNR